jgi:alpha-1,2-mannosyltransferase
MPDPNAAESPRAQIAKADFSPRLWCLLTPFVLLVVIVFASPNFRWQDGQPRTAPYGSDFLQEWVGGQIVLSPERRQLYDLEFVKSRQHDRSVVGFDWPVDQYFPMVYPPFYYFLVSPLARLDFRWATLLWAGLSTLAFITTGYLIQRFYPPARRKFAVWFVAAACFIPWISCLTMGQKSSFLLLLFTGTFLLLHHRRPFLAGVVFGLVAFKPHVGIPLGFIMLWQRQWAFASGALLSVGFLVGASCLIEPQLWVDYFQIVAGMGDYVQTSGYKLADSHNLWGAAQLTFFFLDPEVVKWIAAGLALGTMAAVMIGLRKGFQPGSSLFPLQFSVLVLATVLVSPHFLTYDLTILLLPMILIVAQIGFRPQKSLTQWMLGLTLLIYALAGSFPVVAAVIRFQPSLLVIGGLMFVLISYLRSSERLHNELPASPARSDQASL